MGEVSPMGGFFAQALDGLCAYVKSACAHDTSCLPFLSSAFTQNRRKDLHHSDSDFYLDVIKMCVCVCVYVCVWTSEAGSSHDCLCSDRCARWLTEGKSIMDLALMVTWVKPPSCTTHTYTHAHTKWNYLSYLWIFRRSQQCFSPPAWLPHNQLCKMM